MKKLLINFNMLSIILLSYSLHTPALSGQDEEEYSDEIINIMDSDPETVDDRKRDTLADTSENSPNPKRQKVAPVRESITESSSDDSSSDSSDDSSSDSSSDSDDSTDSSSDSDSSSDYSSDSEGNDKKESKKKILLKLMNSGVTDKKILRRKSGLPRESFNTYLHSFRQKNLISSDYNKKFIDDNLLWKSVANQIKNKRNINDILRFCNFKVKAQEQKLRLNTIINKCYKNKLLKPKDALYLKAEAVVIGRRGNTKEKILAFLKERSNGSPTKSVIKLLEEFNKSPQKQDRRISRSTFYDHVSEMMQPQNRYYSRMKPFIRFYNSCKDPEQTRKSLMNSKK